jgi:hypothetical protein
MYNSIIKTSIIRLTLGVLMLMSVSTYAADNDIFYPASSPSSMRSGIVSYTEIINMFGQHIGILGAEDFATVQLPVKESKEMKAIPPASPNTQKSLPARFWNGITSLSSKVFGSRPAKSCAFTLPPQEPDPIGSEELKEFAAFKAAQHVREIAKQKAKLVEITAAEKQVAHDGFLERLVGWQKLCTRMTNKLKYRHETTWASVPEVLIPTRDNLMAMFQGLHQDIAIFQVIAPDLYERIMKSEAMQKFMADKRFDPALRASFKKQTPSPMPVKKIPSIRNASLSMKTLLKGVGALLVMTSPSVSGLTVTGSCEVSGQPSAAFDDSAGLFLSFPPTVGLINCTFSTADSPSTYFWEFNMGPPASVSYFSPNLTDFVSPTIISGNRRLASRQRAADSPGVSVSIQPTPTVCFPSTGSLYDTCNSGSFRGDCPVLSWKAQTQDGLQADTGLILFNPNLPVCPGGASTAESLTGTGTGGGDLSTDGSSSSSGRGGGGGQGTDAGGGSSSGNGLPSWTTPVFAVGVPILSVGVTVYICRKNRSTALATKKSTKNQGQHATELAHMDDILKEMIPLREAKGEAKGMKFKKIWDKDTNDLTQATAIVANIKLGVSAHIAASSRPKRVLGQDKGTMAKLMKIMLDLPIPLKVYKPTVSSTLQTSYATPNYDAILAPTEGVLTNIDAIVGTYIKNELGEDYLGGGVVRGEGKEASVTLSIVPGSPRAPTTATEGKGSDLELTSPGGTSTRQITLAPDDRIKDSKYRSRTMGGDLPEGQSRTPTEDGVRGRVLTPQEIAAQQLTDEPSSPSGTRQSTTPLLPSGEGSTDLGPVVAVSSTASSSSGAVIVDVGSSATSSSASV